MGIKAAFQVLDPYDVRNLEHVFIGESVYLFLGQTDAVQVKTVHAHNQKRLNPIIHPAYLSSSSWWWSSTQGASGVTCARLACRKRNTSALRVTSVPLVSSASIRRYSAFGGASPRTITSQTPSCRMRYTERSQSSCAAKTISCSGKYTDPAASLL